MHQTDCEHLAELHSSLRVPIWRCPSESVATSWSRLARLSTLIQKVAKRSWSKLPSAKPGFPRGHSTHKFGTAMSREVAELAREILAPGMVTARGFQRVYHRFKPDQTAAAQGLADAREELSKHEARDPLPAQQIRTKARGRSTDIS